MDKNLKTEVDHEYVEHVKARIWDIATSSSGEVKSRALAAFGALEVLAEELRKKIEQDD